MGAWGYYPKDSDGALDLKGIINDTINKELEDIKYYAGYDYAGLIMMLLQQGYFIKYKYINKALEYIKSELVSTIKWKEDKGGSAIEDKINIIIMVEKEFSDILNRQKDFYLTTKRLAGKDISTRTEKWRLKKLDESTILAPNGWLERKDEECVEMGIVKMD